MLLTLFCIFLIIAATLLYLAQYTKESLYSFIGFFILFLIGGALLTGGLEYKTGFTEVTHFQYINETGGLPQQAADNLLHNSTTTRTDNYQAYQELDINLIGLIISILGGFGLGLTWFNYKRGK